MDKALLAQILELCHEPIYLGTSTVDLRREIAENRWLISATREECAEVTVAEVMSAMHDVTVSWRTQMVTHADSRGALFYMWFDEQASQLRCCIISDRNSALPFSHATEPVSMMEPIIAAFLSSPYHEGIPWDELTEVEWSDPNDDDVMQEIPFNVYVEQMP